MVSCMEDNKLLFSLFSEMDCNSGDPIKTFKVTYNTCSHKGGDPIQRVFTWTGKCQSNHHAKSKPFNSTK